MGMNAKAKATFLVLVLIQALHSIEEYYGKLWEVFPPATYVCSLVSDDLVFGFLVINVGLFAFGILGYIFLVRTGSHFGPFLAWFWIIIEVANGIVHPAWSIDEGGYTPGVLTAPFLLITSIYLIKLMAKNSESQT